MQIRRRALFGVFGLVLFRAEPSIHAQATFQNLDFESAMVEPNPPGHRAPLSSAFPGWNWYIGTGTTPADGDNMIPINVVPFSAASDIGLLGPEAGFMGVPFAGDYTASLQGGSSASAPSMTLGQVGLVPEGTLSLRFFGWSNRSNFVVSMSGQPLSVVPLQDFGNYQEYGADIAAFAGQTVDLRFTQRGGLDDPDGWGTFFFDQISFSPSAVPEPSTWALLALGSALFWSAARRRRK